MKIREKFGKIEKLLVWQPGKLARAKFVEKKKT
jgi:hypothetical protein